MLEISQKALKKLVNRGCQKDLLEKIRQKSGLDFQFKVMRNDMFEILRFMRTVEMRIEQYSSIATYRELFEKSVGKDHSGSQPQQVEH